MSTEEVLTGLLQVAVPLLIEELKGCSPEEVVARAQRCGSYVAAHGDDILFKSSEPGGTAEAFNRLAEGIAALSFAPGGVDAFGAHWEAQHPRFTSANGRKVFKVKRRHTQRKQ